MQIIWYLFIALMVIVLQGLLFRLRGLSNIRYSRYFNTEACVEGDEVYLVEQVVNRSLIPLPWLRMESQIHANLKFERQANLDVSEGDEYQNHRSVFSLMPYSRITRKHTIRCLKRGVYTLDSMTMGTGDVLGTYQTSKKMNVQAELVVYPKSPEWDVDALPSHSWQGDIVVKRWIIEDPFMISGVREYRPGDPLKGINWKATARGDRMLVHNRDFTADHRLVICVNTEVNEEMWSTVTDPELVEREIRQAVSVVEFSLSQGIETGYYCNGYFYQQSNKVPIRIPAASGESHRETILHAMAATVIARSVPFEMLLSQDVQEGRSNTDYVLITPFVNKAIQDQIEALQYLGNAVKVMDLTEIDEEERRGLQHA